MAFLNLSFETIDGAGPGCADGWLFSSTARAWAWAGYGTTTPKAPWETFNREWSSNESYLFALSTVVAATYAAVLPPKTVENFEEFWDSNQAYAYGISGTAAQYDSGPENFEDFEEDWSAGYLYAFVGVGTDLTAAVFQTGAGTGTAETLEGDWSTNEGYLYAFVGVGTDLTAAVYAGGDAFDKFDSAAGWLVCNTV